MVYTYSSSFNMYILLLLQFCVYLLINYCYILCVIYCCWSISEVRCCFLISQCYSHVLGIDTPTAQWHLAAGAQWGTGNEGGISPKIFEFHNFLGRVLYFTNPVNFILLSPKSQLFCLTQTEYICSRSSIGLVSCYWFVCQFLTVKCLLIFLLI